MPVLRTEVKIVPTQMLETTIIGVPANEWSRMKWEISISAVFVCTCAVALLIFYWSGMPDIDNTASFARATFGLDILSNMDNRESWTVMIFATFCCLVPLFAFAFTNITDNEQTLLKKHGWDGKSLYRVELEYPQHFLLD